MYRLIVATILAAVIGVAALRPLGAQVTPEPISQLLAESKETYVLEAETLGEALLRFSVDWRTPAVIVWQITVETKRPVRLTFQDTSGEEVLSKLLDQFPEYVVRQKDQYLWIGLRSEEGNPASFLNLQVPHFEARGEPLGYASGVLYNRVVDIMKGPSRPSQPPGSGIGGSIAYGLGGERKVDVSVSDISVCDLLGLLVASAGERSYIVTYPEEDSFTTNGYRKTTGYRNPKSSSDRTWPWAVYIGWDEILANGEAINTVQETADPAPAP
jgi:hypothetical protein